MNKLRRVVNNTFISLIGQAVTWSSTFALTIAYGRFLGDVKFGELYFAITFVMLVGFPLEFGFNQQLTRDVAQDGKKALSYFSNTLFLKIALWVILYLIIQGLCYLLGYNGEQRLLVGICGVTLLSGAIANTFGSLHNAFERVVFPVVGTVLEKGLSALAGILILRAGGTVEQMALVLLAGSAISALWQAIWFFRLEGFHISFSPKIMRELLFTSLPFLIYGVLGVIYYRLDTVLLSLFTNTAVVGWYGAGYRLFDTLVFLPNIVIMAIMYPILAKFSVTDEADMKLAIEKSMNFLLFCGVPIAAGMIAAAPSIVGFLYHRDEFLNTIPVLIALAPGLVFLYVNTLLSTILMSTKNERKISIMAAVALVFNLGLNLVLIPLYKHVGAAIVTSLTEFLLLCLAVAFAPKNLLPWGSLRVGVKILLASLAMSLAILPLRTSSIGLLLAVAVAVYFGAVVLLQAIPPEDILTLFRAIRHRKRKQAHADLSAQDERTELELDLAELAPEAQSMTPEVTQ